jgi:hypothetical protein
MRYKTRIDRFKIKRAMQGKFATQEELAIAANLSTTTLSTATDSYAWRASTLDAIANALGVASLTLLTVDEVEETKDSLGQHTNDAPPTSATALDLDALEMIRAEAAVEQGAALFG